MLSLAKCAKLVDEKIIDYCVAVVPDFEPKILMKGVHLTNFEQNCSIESWFLSYEERYTYYESKKAKKGKCHRTTFYSIFNMSSCRKSAMQNGLPKITQIEWIFYSS